MEAQPIIADRAEFVDALHLLRKGHVLVKVSEAAGGCVLDGGRVFHSYDTLKRYGLIDEFQGSGGTLTDKEIVYLFNNPGAAVPAPTAMCLLAACGMIATRRRN